MTGDGAPERDVRRAAALLAHLPHDSALRVAMDPDNELGFAEAYLMSIEYDLRCIIWSLTAEKGTPKPRPMRLPSEMHGRRLASVEEEKAEVDALLGIGREDEDGRRPDEGGAKA